VPPSQWHPLSNKVKGSEVRRGGEDEEREGKRKKRGEKKRREK
jgi:hypothetical protein